MVIKGIYSYHLSTLAVVVTPSHSYHWARFLVGFISGCDSINYWWHFVYESVALW
ncbi:unknown protein [Microcystis aeruginosa NIES-843]|uniref:Uncharacterized protein n=1 Tax=Microcystis aeruginosa (strain NIES-843 / IAM M-2473) TaxID=449447 RepID=B0JGP6_MICAN|nr:unknown protein [Microcystis aeruginosa NIES-843]